MRPRMLRLMLRPSLQHNAAIVAVAVQHAVAIGGGKTAARGSIRLRFDLLAPRLHVAVHAAAGSTARDSPARFMPDTFTTRYAEFVASGKIEADPAQADL